MGGQITSVVKNNNSKNGKYFFTLKVKRRLSQNDYICITQSDLKSSTTSNTPGMFNTLRNFTNTSLKVKVDMKRQNSPSTHRPRNIFNQTQPSTFLDMSNIITRVDSQYSQAAKNRSRQLDMFAQNTSLTNLDEHETSAVNIKEAKRIQSM